MSLETTTVVRTTGPEAQAILDRHNQPLAIKPKSRTRNQRLLWFAGIIVSGIVAFYSQWVVNAAADAIGYDEAHTTTMSETFCKRGSNYRLFINAKGQIVKRWSPKGTECRSVYTPAVVQYDFADFRAGHSNDRGYDYGKPVSTADDGALFWVPFKLFAAVWLVGGLTFMMRRHLWRLVLNIRDHKASRLYDAAVRRGMIRHIDVPTLYRRYWLDVLSQRSLDLKKAGLWGKLPEYDQLLASRSDIITHQQDFLQGIADDKTSPELKRDLEIRVRQELSDGIVDDLLRDAQREQLVARATSKAHDMRLQHLLDNTPVYTRA